MREPRTASEEEAAGELSKFRDLFLRYHRALVYVFRRWGFSQADSVDLTQETFLQAYKSWGNYRGESRIDTWLFSIARHVHLSEVRTRMSSKRNTREVSLEEAWGPEDTGGIIQIPSQEGGNPLEIALETERARVLREAMETLPPQMQRCVLLRLDRDFKYREIAELMGISIETVKAHLFMARQLLKEKLAVYFDDIDEL